MKPSSQRPPRKKSPRNKGTKKPGVSLSLKQKWQDPEFRERMRLRDVARIEAARKSPEKFWRRGVPDGMRKRDADAMWMRAGELADRFIKIMKDQGELPDEIVQVDVHDDSGTVTNTVDVTVPTTDIGKAEAALREAFVLAVGPSTQQIKIQAINTVLNFTKSKPESKSKLTLNKAEDFLDEIMKPDDERTAD